MDNYNNINEFRTYIIQKYHTFPTRVINNINFYKKKSTSDSDEVKAAKEI